MAAMNRKTLRRAFNPALHAFNAALGSFDSAR